MFKNTNKLSEDNINIYFLDKSLKDSGLKFYININHSKSTCQVPLKADPFKYWVINLGSSLI